jgi:hypothetical protein
LVTRLFLKPTSNTAIFSWASPVPPTILRKIKTKRPFTATFLAGQGTTATDLRATLHDKMQQAFGAQSRLMLLGEDACRKRAERLHSAVLKADKSFRFDGQNFDLSRYVEVTRAVRDAREEFYVEMSKAFEHTREA